MVVGANIFVADSRDPNQGVGVIDHAVNDIYDSALYLAHLRCFASLNISGKAGQSLFAFVKRLARARQLLLNFLLVAIVTQFYFFA